MRCSLEDRVYGLIDLQERLRCAIRTRRVCGVANTLNGASGKRCDIDGQAEGRMSGSE
jgi:hypothetical protein